MNRSSERRLERKGGMTIRRKHALGAAALALGLLLTVVSPGRTFAAFSYCNADPIVQLSNGQQVTITVQVGDNALDIQSINFTVHVPAGLSTKNVWYSRGALKHKEQVVVVADNPAGQYDTQTQVLTGSDGTGGVPVSTNTSTRSAYGTISGLSGQTLAVHLIDTSI